MIAAGAPSLFPASAPQGAIALSVLRDCPLILYRRFELLLTEAFAEEGISPQIFCIADDARTAMMWAEAGLGIAVVPQSAWRIMPHQNLTFHELAQPKLTTRIAAICKKGEYLTDPAHSFLELFCEPELPHA